jgi:YhcH/YjgK/YiaL family protein
MERAMVLDRLENWKLYFPKGGSIARAFEFIESEVNPSIPDGRFEIDGDRIFSVISTYETKPLEQCRFEVHRRYLDVQHIIGGSEVIGWAGRDRLRIEDPYDEQKDVEFFHPPDRSTLLELLPGQFAFFYPDDAHAPGGRLGSVTTARKVLVKILIS